MNLIQHFRTSLRTLLESEAFKLVFNIKISTCDGVPLTLEVPQWSDVQCT